MHFPAPAATAALTILGLITACGDEKSGSGPVGSVENAGVVAPETALKTAPLEAYRAGEIHCGEDGALRGQLYGAISANLQWEADTLRCDGMPRPRGEGARLRFSGPFGDAGTPLAIIIAMPSLEHGKRMTGVPSNVTIIEEGQGRFFSAADLDTCWADVETATEAESDDARYRVEGVLYCIAPLAEVGGSASVTIDEVEFVGRLGWDTGS